MELEVFMKQMYKCVSEPVSELSQLVYNHFGKKPMEWTGIDKLTEYALNEQFVERVFGLYEYLLHKNDLMLDINPSQYYKIIYKFQLASKSLNYEVTRLTECYLFLANYAIRCYNYNFANTAAFIKTVKFYNAEKTALNKIIYLSALLRSFSEALYCDEHTIAGEVYCPIRNGENIIIAKKYRWLNAFELRTELKDFLYSAVDVYIAYSHLSEEPYTDIVGNIITNVRLNDYIQGYYIALYQSDGRKIIIKPNDNINHIIQYFEKNIHTLSVNYKEMSIEKRLWEKIRCEYYALKPFAVACGIDWEPIFYNIDIEDVQSRERPIVVENLKVLQLQSEKEIIEQIYKINNPEVHW